MDTVLLFALPLVGGLIFCSTWNFTRWRVAREDGHRLYFRAVLFGALIFALVATLRQFEVSFPLWVSAVSVVRDAIKPMAKDQAAAKAIADLAITCFLAMLAGWPLAKSLNILFRKNYWLRRAIAEDELEKFLLDSVDNELPIIITMDDGKVYVGFLVAGFDPAIGRKCLSLLPLISGYRDGATQKVKFTTFYTQVYGSDTVKGLAELPEPLAHLTAEHFITVIPADRISSCRLFDATAYQVFQKTNPPETVDSV